MAIKIGNLLSNLGVWRLRVWRCALLMVSWWCLHGVLVVPRWCLGGALVVSSRCLGCVPVAFHCPSLKILRAFFRVGHTMHQVVFTVAPSSFQRFHPVVTLTIMTAADDDDGDDDDDGGDDDGGDDDVDEDGDGDGDDDDDCMCLQVWVKAVSGRMLTYVWT